MKNSDHMHIGTSGWHYDHWQGVFYPQDLPGDEWLDYYSRHFFSVEVNNSFYQLPEADTLREWRETTQDDFLFSVKASRYITHMKKLKDPLEPVNRFLERVELLEEKLGPILFQLPPNWHYNPTRLKNFLNTLPEKGYRFAFEFRDPSWFDSQTYDLLSAHNAAFCIYDLAGNLSPRELTADWVYVRLHGPGQPYHGKYSAETLAGWAGAFSSWGRQGKEIYCYFNNDTKGNAVKNAMALQSMVLDDDKN